MLFLQVGKSTERTICAKVMDLIDQLIGMGWMQVREGDSAKLAARYVQLRVRTLLF